MTISDILMKIRASETPLTAISSLGFKIYFSNIELKTTGKTDPLPKETAEKLAKNIKQAIHEYNDHLNNNQ